jgi:hypothetical protein
MTPHTMRRAYCREAAMMLLVARLAVRVVPSAWLFAWADRAPRRPSRFAADEANWVAWAIERVGAYPGMKTLCLPRALAAHAMLRRRGIASRLCLGVACDGGELAAHAWTEVGERRIVGGDVAGAFTQLAAFGGVK